MTPPIDVVITVELGGRRRQITATALASALGKSAASVREGLLRLLYQGSLGHVPAPGDDEYPQEEGDSRGRSLPSVRKRNGDKQIRSYPFGEDGGPGEETPIAVDKSERLADYLADVLRDDKSLAFYKLVAAAVPHEVVREALDRALDVPRHQVRRSRAAIFTALVLPHLRAHRRGAPGTSPHSPL